MTDPIAFGWQENSTWGGLMDTPDGPTRTLGATKTLAVMQAQAISENQRGEVPATDYAHQLTTGGGKPGQGYPAALVDTRVRRLTPVECERLMGWPDDHTRWRADGTEVADSVRYRMCGNGVASPVAEWLATQLDRTL